MRGWVAGGEPLSTASRLPDLSCGEPALKMRDMADWKKVAAVAERQHMTVATWQLRHLGVSSTALGERVQRHGWRRLHRGVIGLPAPRDPIRKLAAAVIAYSRPAHAEVRVAALKEHGRDSVTALVEAALRCGQLVCGPSSLWLHGLHPTPQLPWIRLDRGLGTASRREVCVRYGPAAGATTWIQGLPCTDVEQAVIELPSCSDDERKAMHHRLTRLLATADARRLTTVDAVQQRLEEVGRVRGATAVANAVSDLQGTLSHSATEAEARRLAEEVLTPHKLTLHPRPYLVEVGGVPVGEADLAVVEIRLDLEVDGPHHLLPAQVRKDQLRDRRMRRADWDVERFSTELIDLSPRTFQAQVAAAVQHRLTQVRSA